VQETQSKPSVPALQQSLINEKENVWFLVTPGGKYCRNNYGSISNMLSFSSAKVGYTDPVQNRHRWPPLKHGSIPDQSHNGDVESVQHYRQLPAVKGILHTNILFISPKMFCMSAVTFSRHRIFPEAKCQLHPHDVVSDTLPLENVIS
jgi:hypothetical protein